MSTIEWRWSNGEEYLKSARRRRIKQEQDQYQEQDQEQEPYQEEAISQTAIYQSLNGFDTTFSRNENPSGNRREYLDNKISDREMIFQRGTNPFLQTTDYVKDVVARDMFLKPRNTTFEREETELLEES
jgi:hypothetical protein